MELYSYYRLDERNSESVSGIWKGLHISLLFMGLFCSIVATVIFHIIIAWFDTNCVLFPIEIILESNSSDFITTTAPPVKDLINITRIDLPIDFIRSQWSNMNVCYSSLYNPILSAIFGIVWLTFFLMCPKGGKSNAGLTRPWRIVIPSAVFTFIYSILCLIVVHHVTDGLSDFQLQFRNITRIHGPKYQSAVDKIDGFIVVTIVSNWLYASSWVVGFVVLILRCLFIADFQLIKVSIQLLNTDAESNPVNDQQPEPSMSYYTPATSKELLDAQSILAQAYVEPKKVNDNEDPSAFEDFDPAFDDDFNMPPRANSSRVAEASNHDIVLPKDLSKVTRSVSFTPFDIDAKEQHGAYNSDSSLSADDHTSFIRRQ